MRVPRQFGLAGELESLELLLELLSFLLEARQLRLVRLLHLLEAVASRVLVLEANIKSKHEYRTRSLLVRLSISAFTSHMN